MGKIAVTANRTFWMVECTANFTASERFMKFGTVGAFSSTPLRHHSYLVKLRMQQLSEVMKYEDCDQSK